MHSMPDNPIIWETEHWKVILHEDQRYLGRTIVSAKNRNRPNLPTLTDEEWLDFSHNVVAPFEASAKIAFGAELFNWSCLMNLAYQNTPPDPHVHWHVQPRYRHPVEFEGGTYSDEAFGNHYVYGDQRVATRDVLDKIAERIRSAKASL